VQHVQAHDCKVADTSSTELATMSVTLEFTLGDLQASKACIAAALADVAIKLHASKPGSPPAQLLLSPVDLTQPNAIAQYIGLPQRMLFCLYCTAA